MKNTIVATAVLAGLMAAPTFGQAPKAGRAAYERAQEQSTDKKSGQKTTKTLTVECKEQTINDVLKTLNPRDSNTLQVIGTCRETQITISDFADLTITGVTKGNAAIESANGDAIFWVVGSHVQLQNLIIDGGLWDVMCREFSVCRFSGNTIQHATGNGIEIDSADATFSGDVIQDNANFGITLTSSRIRVTQVTVKGSTAGAWGPGTGVEVDTGSSLVVEQLTVQGNQGPGVSLVGNSSLTNRPWAGTFLVSDNSGGGVWVTEESSADLSGATVINNLVAPGGGGGVIIDGNSEASFWGGGTFTGNQVVDIYCGALNGLAAAPQLATVGVTNCPSTYK